MTIRIVRCVYEWQNDPSAQEIATRPYVKDARAANKTAGDDNNNYNHVMRNNNR